MSSAGVTTAQRGRAAIPWVLAVLLLGASAAPIAWHYLVSWPQDQWQVDLEVYREAGRSVIYGRPIYDSLTEPPQLLPFTYPPFAALLALPIALVPFTAAAWLWTAGQVAAVFGTVWLAGRSLLERAGRWRPLATAVFAGVLVWLHPVSDGIRFGQVNAFIVLVCLVDLSARRPWWARGALVGLVTAVKLTPGVFLVHFVASRRWRAAAGLLVGLVGATVLALLVLPEGSLAFWGGAVQDPNRLGSNRGTSNQSLHGFVLRLGPHGVAGTLAWAVLVVAAVVAALTVARRPTTAGRCRSRSEPWACSPYSSRRCPGSTTSRGWWWSSPRSSVTAGTGSAGGWAVSSRRGSCAGCPGGA